MTSALTTPIQDRSLKKMALTTAPVINTNTTPALAYIVAPNPPINPIPAIVKTTPSALHYITTPTLTPSLDPVPTPTPTIVPVLSSSTPTPQVPAPTRPLVPPAGKMPILYSQAFIDNLLSMVVCDHCSTGRVDIYKHVSASDPTSDKLSVHCETCGIIFEKGAFQHMLS